MADIYRTPAATPPPDEELDKLAETTNEVLDNFLNYDPLVTAVIRNQHKAIRRLRIALAQERARRESVEAIAKIRRDEQTAGWCGGSQETVSVILSVGEGKGLCRVCNGPVDFDSRTRALPHELPAL